MRMRDSLKIKKQQALDEDDALLRVLLSQPALWLGTLLALVSVADGFRNAMLHSLDFQWSPARLLAQHIDPWAVYLAGDPQHRILLNQVPNYLQELYVLLLPLGYLPFLSAKLIWAVVNLALVLVSCACIVRLYELGARKGWLFTVLVLTGTPFRVVLGNGQITALMLAALALWALVESARSRGLLLGLAWAKYSVPPVLAVFLLLRRRWRVLMYSVLPPLAGFVFMAVWLHTAAGTLLLEPFRASANNVSPGLANIMALCEIALRRPPLFRTMPDAFYFSMRAGWSAYLPYACGILLACALAFYFFRYGSKVDGRIQMACLTAASLLCFKHQIYDFLLLIFCLALALKADRIRARNWLLLLIGYFWYIERLVHIRRWEFWPAVVMISFVLLAGLIAATWKLRDSAQWGAEWKI